MRIAIIDADLIGRKKHRFPNLACMKISSHHKKLGDDVELLTSYDYIENYDKVYISKVFTDTPIPDGITSLSYVEYGGTGFYFDEAPNLPYEIEHAFPDYHLYDDFINHLKEEKIKEIAVDDSDDIEDEIKSIERKFNTEFKMYLDYSIGFLTRGCFRKCGFCVNKKYDRVFKHSPLNEFYDSTRKKICLLDDNFLGFPNWRDELQELRETGKPFTFKQGLDERLLTPEKCDLLFNSKYDGEITFAFDNIKDYRIIEKKLKLIREHSDKQIKFYVLCGFDYDGKYDSDFWRRDIIDTFKRIELLGRYKAIPYIMRFNKYEESQYRGIYITLARWINQPAFFKKKSIEDFANLSGGASIRYLDEFKKDYPNIYAEYFTRKYWEVD